MFSAIGATLNGGAFYAKILKKTLRAQAIVEAIFVFRRRRRRRVEEQERQLHPGLRERRAAVQEPGRDP